MSHSEAHRPKNSLGRTKKGRNAPANFRNKAETPFCCRRCHRPAFRRLSAFLHSDNAGAVSVFEIEASAPFALFSIGGRLILRLDIQKQPVIWISITNPTEDLRTIAFGSERPVHCQIPNNRKAAIGNKIGKSRKHRCVKEREEIRILSFSLLQKELQGNSFFLGKRFKIE